MKITRECWQCEYVDCGHVWLAVGVAPEKCAKCRRRGWNVTPVTSASLGQSDSSDHERNIEEKARRKEKKARRHAELKADCVAALPSIIPEAMQRKLNTPPTDHHPLCNCLRCQAHPPKKLGLRLPRSTSGPRPGYDTCPHHEPRPELILKANASRARCPLCGETSPVLRGKLYASPEPQPEPLALPASASTA